MKKIIYAGLLLPVLFSCGGNGTNNDSDSLIVKDKKMSAGDTAMNSNSIPADTNSVKSDSMRRPSATTVTDKAVIDFVQKASSGGMMEISLGNIAARNAQSQRVRGFGAMMVTDHTAANDELKMMAASGNISVPAELTGETKKHVDMMSTKTGAAFDKAYMSMMLSDHKKDVEEFKKASTSLKDPAYKAFAAKTLPVLQKHLDSAQAISKGL